MPNDPLDSARCEIRPQCIKFSRAIMQNFLAVWSEEMLFAKFWVSLNLRAAEFVRAVYDRIAERIEGFAVPSILRSITNREPALLLAGVLVDLVGGFEIFRRLGTRLHFEALVELPVTNEAARAVKLACRNAFTGENPFRARDGFVANQPITIVVALKERNDFLHDDPRCAKLLTY